MKARIHRGASEIGGNCVELEADGDRLVLDSGARSGLTTARGPAADSRPDRRTIEPLLGVVISHAHPDHYGLVEPAA